MESLDSIKQPSTPASKLYLGIGLFTAGILPTAIGGVRVIEQLLLAIGVPQEPSLLTGIAATGLGISIVLFLLTLRISTNQTVQTSAKFGVGTMILGLTLFVLNTPSGIVPNGITPSVFIYSLGFILLYGSLLTSLAIITTPSPSTNSKPTSIGSLSTNTTWTRSSNNSPIQNPTQLPTDGGEEDNDLQFPLDDEHPPK